MTLAAILCTDAAWLLGDGGRLPWHLPAEQRLFRDVTLGARVIMGRRTWQSLRGPLPGRENVVLSRDPVDGATWARTLPEALAGGGFVIGGASLYAAAWPFVERVHLTQIAHTFDCDEGAVYLPRVCRDLAGWRETERRTVPVGPGNAWPWTYRALVR